MADDDMVRVMQVRHGGGGRGDAVANRLLSAMQGFMGGREMIEKKKDRRLDRYDKLLAINEKLAKIETERQNQKVFGNMAKAMGLMPMEEAESGNARGVAHESLGGPKGPVMHTPENKLAKFLEDSGDGWVSFGKEGFRFSMRKGKGKGAGAEKDYARRAAAHRMAVDAAAREIAATEGPDPVTEKMRLPRNDEVMKYLPSFERFLSGDRKGLEDGMEKIRKEGDPFSLAGDGDPLGGGIDLDMEDEP